MYVGAAQRCLNQIHYPRFFLFKQFDPLFVPFLIQNAVYKGEYFYNHKTIKLFWKVFRELELDLKKKFLGKRDSSVHPSADLPNFVHWSQCPRDSLLPASDFCLFLLLFPLFFFFVFFLVAIPVLSAGNLEK